MFKKISVFFVAIMLAGCSSISDITSYIPFMGKGKKVIDLDKDKIDQKSYAAAYEATVATYKDRVTKNFFVDNFASGESTFCQQFALKRLKLVCNASACNTPL